MALTKKQINIIEETIKNSLLTKLKKYKPETNSMPFHYRLLGKDRMALFSFIHSLNTTFGTSIFEPVAETIAKLTFKSAETQFFIGDQISEKALLEIQKIINELSQGKGPNKPDAIERIRNVSNSGKTVKIKTVKVDLMVKGKDDFVHLFDLKTVKPNKSNFKDFKRTLLEWIGLYLFIYPNANVNSYLAIPYNPYEPNPYERWTMKGMIDIDNELKVAEEFWDFLGGKGAYEELLKCFERVGIELRPEIDKYFRKFRS